MSQDIPRLDNVHARTLEAFDPVRDPEAFEGVLPRRIMAFVIDLIVITAPVVFVALFVFLLGIVTLGLFWVLYFLLWPAAVLWAIAYYGLTLGSEHSATIGMRFMDIEMRTRSGEQAYFVLGAVHAILYWISVSALTPLVLVVGLFNDRRRLLHDLVLGTFIVNNPRRAASLRRNPVSV